MRFREGWMVLSATAVAVAVSMLVGGCAARGGGSPTLQPRPGAYAVPARTIGVRVVPMPAPEATVEDVPVVVPADVPEVEVPVVVPPTVPEVEPEAVPEAMPEDEPGE